MTPLLPPPLHLQHPHLPQDQNLYTVQHKKTSPYLHDTSPHTDLKYLTMKTFVVRWGGGNFISPCISGHFGCGMARRRWFGHSLRSSPKAPVQSTMLDLVITVRFLPKNLRGEFPPGINLPYPL